MEENKTKTMESCLQRAKESTDSFSRIGHIDRAVKFGADRKEVISLYFQWAKEAEDSSSVCGYINKAVEFGDKVGAVKILEEIRANVDLERKDSAVLGEYDNKIASIKSKFNLMDKIKYRVK